MVYRICIGGPDDGHIKIIAPEVPQRCVLIFTWKNDEPDLHPDGYYHGEAYEPLEKDET